MSGAGIESKMQKRKRKKSPADQNKRIRKQKEKIWIAEVLSVLCVIAARAFVVIRYGISGAGAASYAEAMVSESNMTAWTGHHVSDLYTCFLSVLFRFFGNKAEIAAFAQLLLQCAAIFIFAAALKKLLGSAAVISFLLAASFVPHFLSAYEICSPDLLLCLLFGFAFYATACLIRSVRAGKRLGAALSLLAAGILAGILIWLILPDLKNMTYESYQNLCVLICLAAAGAALQGIVNGVCALRAACRKKRMTAEQTDAPKSTDGLRGNAPEKDTKAAAEHEEPDKPKINYIPNPLPLPKKHVKKVMGFDFDVEDEKQDIDFDYQGIDGDDFDI